MTKGKFGIRLSIIAIVAYLLAIFDMTTAMILVIGFAIVAENDEWLTRQVLQPLFAWIGATVITFCVDLVFGFFARIATALSPLSFDLSDILNGRIGYTGAAGAIAGVGDFINGCVKLTLLIFFIIAILRLLKGSDANMPIFGGITKRAMSVFTPKPKYTYQPQAPQQQQYQQPQAPQQAQAPQAPQAQAGWDCTTCGATNNTGAFCSSCGKPKS